MKKWLLALTLTVSVFSLAACNSANDSDVVVKSSAGEITKDELFEEMKNYVGERVLSQLIYDKVLSAKYTVDEEEINAQIDGLKAQFGDSFKMALAQYGYPSEEALRMEMRIGNMQEQAGIATIEATDAEIQDAYENYIAPIKGRHILVDTEEEANEIIAQLNSGADFATIAKEKSKDTGSGAQGGELGWFSTGKMVKEFEEVAFALEINAISAPVKTQFGYHIIQITEKEEKASFEELKEKLTHEVKAAKLTDEIVAEAVEKELKAADIKINDKDLENVLGF